MPNLPLVLTAALRKIQVDAPRRFLRSRRGIANRSAHRGVFYCVRTQ